jgi:hypothetical protein
MGELAVREEVDWRGRARELGATRSRSGRCGGRGMRATEGGSVVVMLLLCCPPWLFWLLCFPQSKLVDAELRGC